jgi:hypothetical protein
VHAIGLRILQRKLARNCSSVELGQRIIIPANAEIHISNGKTTCRVGPHIKRVKIGVSFSVMSGHDNVGLSPQPGRALLCFRALRSGSNPRLALRYCGRFSFLAERMPAATVSFSHI